MTEENEGTPAAQAGIKNAPKALTPGEKLTQALYDIHPFKDPSRRYLILSSQRTGSNYLCRRLCNVKGRFGLPSEYLNPNIIQMMLPRLIVSAAQGGKLPLGKYLNAVERARTTADGCFGIKVQPAQLLGAVGRESRSVLHFAQRFDRLVLMTRRDKLGRAISGAIAQATGKWFNDGTEPALDDARIATLFPVIARNLARYVDEERMILDVGKTVAKPLLRIEYEEIEAGGDAAFMSLVDFLAGGEALPLEEEEAAPIPEKPPGEFAKKVRERFLNYVDGAPARP